MIRYHVGIVALLAAWAAAGAAGCKGDAKTAEASKAAAGEVKAGDPAAPDPDAEEPADGDVPMLAAAPARDERAVWALGANRHMAHRLVDGDLVLDGGSPGFARYTRFGLPQKRWKLMVAIDGQATAEPNRFGSLEVPMTAEQVEATRSVWLRVHATKTGKVNVKVNGRKLDRGRVSVVAGWQVVSVPVEGRWQVGENQLVLESNLDGNDVHLHWLRLSREPEGQGAPADLDPLAGTGWDEAAAAFRFRDGVGLAWYVQVPAGAALVADVVGSCKIEVEAKDGDAAMAGGLLAGKGARVDLATLAGKVVRLELRGRDCAAGGTVKDARITLPGLAPPPAPDGAAPKYIVFWVMDALRADHVPTFTPGARTETPNFDKLGASGAVFRQHYVGGNESQVSHSSMFTSLYPAVHTVRTAGNQIRYNIPKKFPILGRLMSDAGYYTIGVTGNGFVGASGGYTRGFEEYRNMMQEKGVVNGRLFGAEVLDDVLRRLTKHVAAKPGDAGKPLFVFMGTVDTHSPWIARQPWMKRYDPGPYHGPFQTAGVAGPLGLMKGKMGCHKVPPIRDIERLRAIYDSAISYQDALLGELVAGLGKLGIADQTMIVVTADHGEELFEERRCGHGASLRDSLARVPLLIHYPPKIATRVITEGSEGIDILPTLLDAIGAPLHETAQGQSLRPLAAGHGGAGWVQPSFASQYEYAFAVRLGRWKARIKSGAPLVLDMEADPDERKDLSASRPVERRYLTDHLGFYLANRATWTKSSWGVVSNMTDAGARSLEETTTP